MVCFKADIFFRLCVSINGLGVLFLFRMTVTLKKDEGLSTYCSVFCLFETGSERSIKMQYYFDNHHPSG